MYQGYISCGLDDPFAVPPAFSTEIVNNPRAYAYTRWAGLPWLIPCDECDGVETITSRGKGFLSPILDPAPWYDVNNPDSWGFLGVLGLEITGGSDSTRQANVSMSISGIGVIGRTYMGPRTMVIRALAIARDDCALEFGLTWLRGIAAQEVNPCGGDPVTFFDCCPCICPEEDMPDPCWADNYFELEFFPQCEGPSEAWVDTYADLESGDGRDETLFPTWPPTYDELIDGPPDAACWVDTNEELITGPPACTNPGGPQWWPDTYQELIDGPPPPFDEEWCDWPDTYFELAEGPAPFACCIDACVGPYMRQFHNCRVTAGPTVLRRPTMTCGALVEIEFTIVAADPAPHSMPFEEPVAVLGGPGDTMISDGAPMSAARDPFATVA